MTVHKIFPNVINGCSIDGALRNQHIGDIKAQLTSFEHETTSTIGTKSSEIVSGLNTLRSQTKLGIADLTSASQTTTNQLVALQQGVSEALVEVNQQLAQNFHGLENKFDLLDSKVDQANTDDRALLVHIQDMSQRLARISKHIEDYGPSQRQPTEILGFIRTSLPPASLQVACDTILAVSEREEVAHCPIPTLIRGTCQCRSRIRPKTSSVTIGSARISLQRRPMHDPSCRFHAIQRQVTTTIDARGRLSLGRFLSGLVEVNFHCSTGAGAFSISRTLRWFNIVPDFDSQVFLEFARLADWYFLRQPSSKAVADRLMSLRMRLHRLYSERKASPNDVDTDGMNHLQVSTGMFPLERNLYNLFPDIDFRCS